MTHPGYADRNPLTPTPPMGDDDEERQETSDDGMSDEEVRSAVGRMVDAAVLFTDGELQKWRKQATEYYKGEPFGNEETGRSQAILTPLRDTVNTIMPSLLKVFWGPEQAVEYEPTRADTVAEAEQATDYVNKVVLRIDNPGFLVFHSWFKDALVRRLGVVKVWWEEDEKSEAGEARAIDEQGVLMLHADESVSITRIEASPIQALDPTTGQPMPLYDVEYIHEAKGGCVKIACVPPEEFLYNRNARSLEDALIVVHRTKKTKSDLIQMGLTEEQIEAAGAAITSLETNLEAQARNPFQTTPDEPGTEDNDIYEYYESYPYIDADGDGIAELRRVCTLGAAHYMIENEPCARRPFALLGPNPEPHTLVGLSIADETMDLQKTTSSILRAALDSLALAVNPRIVYVEGMVSQADVQNHEIGAPIRALQPGMVQPIELPFVGREVFPVLEYFKQVQEDRTGVSKAAAGLNADALQSSTRAAVMATVTAAQAKIELIARIFAETGVKQLFQLLLKLLVENQPRERMAKLRNQWVPVDPRSWDAEMNVSINVALGSGLAEEKIQTLAIIAQKQEQALQLLGPQNPLVTLGQYRNTLAKFVELSGWKDTTQFFQPLPTDWQPPPPQEPPPPDPNMLVAQAEVQRAQADVQKKQLDAQMKQAEMQQQAQIDAERLEMERERIRLQDDRERDKLDADMQLRARELEMKYQMEVDVARIRADMERDREVMRQKAPTRKRSVKFVRDPESGVATSLEVKDEGEDNGE